MFRPVTFDLYPSFTTLKNSGPGRNWCRPSCGLEMDPIIDPVAGDNNLSGWSMLEVDRFVWSV